MEPIIKFNNGEPICLCNNCNVIIIKMKYDSDENYVTSDGGVPPIFCEKCLDIIGDYKYEIEKENSIRKAELIIESCLTDLHIKAAEHYLNNFRLIFEDEIVYHELLVYLYQKEKEILRTDNDIENG